MIVSHQQLDAQIEGSAESASYGAGNCLGIVELANGVNSECGKNFFRRH
jgi:hypothetical protein